MNYPSHQLNETVYHQVVDPHVVHTFDTTGTNEQDPKALQLTYGEVGDPGEDYGVEQPRDEPLHSRSVFREEHRALGEYLKELEVHNADEADVLEGFWKQDEPTDDALEIVTTQSKRERGKYLIETAKGYLEQPFQRPEIFFKHGEWRDTEPTEQVASDVHEVLGDKKNTQSCYKSAFLAADGYGGEISYCEGFALPKYGGLPVMHAWVEVDGVIEVTWPWSGPVPPKNAVYYGVELPWEDVKETMESRPTYASVLMPDELYYTRVQ